MKLMQFFHYCVDSSISKELKTFCNTVMRHGNALKSTMQMPIVSRFSSPQIVLTASPAISLVHLSLNVVFISCAVLIFCLDFYIDHIKQIIFFVIFILVDYDVFIFIFTFISILGLSLSLTFIFILADYIIAIDYDVFIFIFVCILGLTLSLAFILIFIFVDYIIAINYIVIFDHSCDLIRLGMNGIVSSMVFITIIVIVIIGALVIVIVIIGMIQFIVIIFISLDPIMVR